MQLEDMDEEHNDSNRPSLKGNMFENASDKQRKSSYKKVNAASVMSNREDGTEGNE